MLFQLSYPPFYAYSKPNLQVICACHCLNRSQHNSIILMDNSIPVKRQALCYCGLLFRDVAEDGTVGSR